MARQRYNSQSMRIINHISDIHFGRVDPPVAEALVSDLAANPCDLLVISGDFTQRARAKQYQAAAEYCRRLPTPQLVVPGNHDIPLYDVIRRFFSPLGRYRKYISPDLRPFHLDNEIAVLGINTARPFTWSWNGFWKDGRISEEQLADIQTRFCELPKELFKIVVTHHPFIPPPGERIHGIVHGATAALHRMVDCGIDMILAGHLHMGYSGDVRTHHEAIKGSILNVQAGTAISTRRRHEPNAYNRIRLERNHVSIAVRAWNGSNFAQTVTTDYRRQDGVWTPIVVDAVEPPTLVPSETPIEALP
jgi:3',5'-cyclic AMP phosphodiesterase CpdA